MKLIYTTFADKETALEVSGKLVTERLAACANIFEMVSQYIWDGSMVRDHEYACILKTLPEHCQNLTERLKELHPYKTPCVIEWSASVNQSYKGWMESVLVNGLDSL